MSLSSQPVELTVEAAEAGHRLDAFLASHFPDYSRVHLRRVISAGGVRVGRPGRQAGLSAQGGPAGRRSCCPRFPARRRGRRTSRWTCSTRTKYVVVVNKPPGMVVHPARGHWSGTLASALQFHFGPTLSASGGLSRPGIVHRLDRDTSGVILVARNDQAHAEAGQAVCRPVDREGVFRPGCRLSAARPRLHRLPDRVPSARARDDGHPPRPPREPAGRRLSTRFWSGSTVLRR